MTANLWLRAAQECGHRVRVRHADAERVEARVVFIAVFLRSGDLQDDRRQGYLGRGHRDARLVAEIADRLDARIAGNHRHVDVGNVRHGERLGRCAAAARPQCGERRRADRDEVRRARENRVVDRGRRPGDEMFYRDVAEPRRFGVLLDEPLLLHDHERQESDAELAGDAHFAGFRVREGGE
jgi:hypothetical protein